MKTIIVCDSDNPAIILFVMNVPFDINLGYIERIIQEVKDTNPGEWTIDDILSKFEKYEDWQIYNCQDIYRMEV